MLRNRLVRQSAVSVSTSSESTNMPSPPPLRKRRSSQDSRMFRQLSSDSLDSLIDSPSTSSAADMGRRGSRRHSVACGVLYMDLQKPSLKSAFNTAVRRMSDACSLLSTAPSSTYNLSAQFHTPSVKKQEEVILPHVLGTFRQNRPAPKPPAISDSKKLVRSNFQNRRFSTDLPPPTYSEATTGWKQLTPRQKLLTRQHEILNSKASLVAVEDDDGGNPDE